MDICYTPKRGRPRGTYNLSSTEIANFERLYQDNSVARISRITGRCRETITFHLKQRGYQIRPVGNPPSSGIFLTEISEDTEENSRVISRTERERILLSFFLSGEKYSLGAKIVCHHPETVRKIWKEEFLI